MRFSFYLTFFAHNLTLFRMKIRNMDLLLLLLLLFEHLFDPYSIILRLDDVSLYVATQCGYGACDVTITVVVDGVVIIVIYCFVFSIVHNTNKDMNGITLSFAPYPSSSLSSTSAIPYAFELATRYRLDVVFRQTWLLGYNGNNNNNNNKTEHSTAWYALYTLNHFYGFPFSLHAIVLNHTCLSYI